MKNNGVASEKYFEQAMELAYGKHVFVERLPDTKSIKGLIKHGFIQGRPSDYLVTLRGEMFYAEVKSSSNPTSFPFSNIGKEQWRAMLRQIKAGGTYNFYIHNLVTDTWYLVPAEVIVATDSQGTKSLKWSEMKQWIR